MILKITGKKSIINIGNFLYKLSSPLFCFLEHVGRNLHSFKSSNICSICCIYNSLHVNEVNNAGKIFLCTDRYLNRYRISSEFFLDLLNYTEEISSCPVHFIDKGNSRNYIFICLSPNSF